MCLNSQPNIKRYEIYGTEEVVNEVACICFFRHVIFLSIYRHVHKKEWNGKLAFEYGW